MKKGNILIIVLILAVVVGLGITGFFVWKNHQLPKSQTRDEILAEISAQKKRGIEWKEYINTKLGFAVSSPTYETIQEGDNWIEFVPLNFIIKTEPTTTKDIRNKEQVGAFDAYLGPVPIKIYVNKFDIGLLHKGSPIEYEAYAGNNVRTHGWVFSAELPEKQLDKNLALIEQILSTFKFL